MRYVTPLREGGSLPAIVEGDDDGLYVLKFRGAGQGVRALIAELIAGKIGRALGLKVPEIVFMELDRELAMTEPDPEIQELMKASAGLNLALDYLPGSIMFDPALQQVDHELASRIVWFDSYVANVDRTARNTNMLIWHKELWLIDHGAALFYHHDWKTFSSNSQNAFGHFKHHVLLPLSDAVDRVDTELAAKLTPAILEDIVGTIPDDWLDDAREDRATYLEFLTNRLTTPRAFAMEAAG
jgi:hypothetical protein